LDYLRIAEETGWSSKEAVRKKVQRAIRRMAETMKDG
jgi:hypothetical protein